MLREIVRPVAVCRADNLPLMSPVPDNPEMVLPSQAADCPEAVRWIHALSSVVLDRVLMRSTLITGSSWESSSSPEELAWRPAISS
jgi:hypothetical protein